jgi:hypothetical protein
MKLDAQEANHREAYYSKQSGTESHGFFHRHFSNPLDAGQLLKISTAAVLRPWASVGWPLARSFLGDREVIAKTLYEKPRATTQWSSRAMAKSSGLSQSAVVRIC